MSNFSQWRRNRLTHPDKHVVVCEDDIMQQARIANHLADLFGGQGRVQVSFVPGGLLAWWIIQNCTGQAGSVDLVILDHDMPLGNGSELIAALDEYDLRPQVLTFSGIAENNQRMWAIGEDATKQKGGANRVWLADKESVIGGAWDSNIKQILGL